MLQKSWNEKKNSVKKMSSNEIKYEVTPKHEGGQISEGTRDNDVTQNLKLRYVCPRVLLKPDCHGIAFQKFQKQQLTGTSKMRRREINTY